MINCKKQSTVAVIMKDGLLVSIGTNEIHNNQITECPRKGMKSGEGYDLCKTACQQGHHAEVDACLKAGEEAEGATLYLIGHTYCCDSCKQVMEDHGIKRVVISGDGDE